MWPFYPSFSWHVILTYQHLFFSIKRVRSTFCEHGLPLLEIYQTQERHLIRFFALWSVSRSSYSHFVRYKTQEGMLFQMHQGCKTRNEQNGVYCKSHLAEEQANWGTSCQVKWGTHTARNTILLHYILLFVVYPSNCHVVIILCDVGGGVTGVIREPRHRPLLLVSYRTSRIRELPPPADWPGH